VKAGARVTKPLETDTAIEHWFWRVRRTRRGEFENHSSLLCRMDKTRPMARGHLRVYLGPAPGAGKTYRMLEEGCRRRDRGADVVVAFAETHDRPRTEEQLRDLEIVPRVSQEHDGVTFEEMDLASVLARRPAVALVDELAHSNASGSLHAKRWEDVEALLNAGIDVITTVDIQNLESVSDVVEKITGVVQHDSVPDAIVRRAEQVELVDITPEALRRRMAHGNIYAADEIDASLSNYFREGNLAALRELALLWLADRVEDSLQRYLDEHDINENWETRERLIVAVTGSNSDEALLRRAARIASRSGAYLVAVHVVNARARRLTPVDASIARDFVAQLDGTFQEIVDDDVAGALVAFARSERGTQIVIGARRRRSKFAPGRSVVEGVLAKARDLDVHIIAVDDERPPPVNRRRKAAVSWRRRFVGLAGAAVVMPLITVGLTHVHSSAILSAVFPCYLVAVLGLTIWGGAGVGVVSSLAASFLENFYFIVPKHTLKVARPDDVVVLSAFLVFSVGASVLVTQFTRRSNEADRARAEAEILTKAAATVATTHDDLLPVLDSLRAILALKGVALVTRHEGDWSVDLASGESTEGLEPSSRFEIDPDHALILSGAFLDTQDRTMVTAFVARVAAGLRAQRIQHEAAALRAIAEADALRTGLLRAVSHDLRTPLATIEANVSSLLQGDVSWSPDEQQVFLTSIEREVHRLTRLVTNLLDAGRLEAGVVTPRSIDVELDDLVASALETIDTQGRRLEINLPDDLPVLRTDPDLYERVVANVVSNACRFSPPDHPVRIRAGVSPGNVDLLVIDCGPGIHESERQSILAPFQRLNDEGSGAGLGLTVASGFVNLLGGNLRFEDTPGGGLTVVIELRQEPRQ
jgi:two-component system sensor histidine kinase KdpD